MAAPSLAPTAVHQYQGGSLLTLLWALGPSLPVPYPLLIARVAQHPQVEGGSPPRQSPTISWRFVSRTPTTMAVVRKGKAAQAAQSASRNTPQPFSVHCARSVSRGRIIYGPISEHIPTRDRLYAPSVARRSLASTIASGTRVFTRVKRSLSAKAISRAADSGAAVGGSPARTPLAVISGPRQGAFASSLCSTRK